MSQGLEKKSSALPQYLVQDLLRFPGTGSERGGFITFTPIIIDRNYQILEARNTTPEKDFFMSTTDHVNLVGKNFGRVVGVFHTHSNGDVTPNSLDIRQACTYFRNFIVTSEGVHEWGIYWSREKNMRTCKFLASYFYDGVVL